MFPENATAGGVVLAIVGVPLFFFAVALAVALAEKLADDAADPDFRDWQRRWIRGG